MSEAMTIEEYAQVLGAGLGREGVDWAALAAARGISAARWEAAMKSLGGKLAGAPEDSKLAKRFRRLLRDAMAADVSVALPFDAYVQLQIDVHTGVPAQEVYARLGIDLRGFTYASYCWMERFDEDRRLGAYHRLRVKAGIARRRGAAERSELAVYGPANLVRARRCGDCGALKVVAPVSSWIYCDYCAKLIDYDATVALADPAALDPDDVNDVLGRAVTREYKAAIETQDRAAYASIVDWMHLVSAEIVPADVSPRIRDAGYRQRLIEAQFRWDLALRVPSHRELQERYDELDQVATREPTLASFLAHLEVALACWRSEAALLAAAGVFDVHPDGFTADMFVTGNASIFVRPYLAMLDDDEQQRLLAAAGVAHEFIEAPRVELTAAACSRCAAALAVPAGARRCVCAACGVITSLDARRFECGRCGAQVSVEDTGDSSCASCGVTWARS